MSLTVKPDSQPNLIHVAGNQVRFVDKMATAWEGSGTAFVPIGVK